MGTDTTQTYKCQNDRSLSQHGDNDKLKSYYLCDEGHLFPEVQKRNGPV